MATKKRKTKKRRTAAQIAATKKLVAFNKKRRGKKKTAKRRTTKRTAKKKLATRKRRGTPRTMTRDYVVFKAGRSAVMYLGVTPKGFSRRWVSDRAKAIHFTSKAEANRIARATPGAMGVASNSSSKSDILRACNAGK